MELVSEINSLFQRTFSLVKYNLVLTLPFFVFWLLLGFLLMPLTTGGGGILFTLFLLAALIAAFLGGWLNMFKRCVEEPVDENLPDDKRTYDSFRLFREFFPGVGKYFGKMFLGVLLYFFLFNIFMLVIEMLIIPVFGTFESFTQQEMMTALKDPDATAQFWQDVSVEDKSRIFKIAGFEIILTFIFAYLTMFWSQLVVLREIYPIKAIIESFHAVVKNPARTSIIFILNISLILTVFFVGAILLGNPMLKLIMILLFVYALVFFVMTTFLYLEKYEEASSGFQTE